MDASLDYADDLMMAIDELLHPEEEVSQCKIWLSSGLQICAVAKIIEKLDEI